MTMLILLLKSRFKSTGIDNSEYFEETYMAYMVNRIIQKMVEKDFTAQRYVNKHRTVRFHEKIAIKVELGQNEFDRI